MTRQQQKDCWNGLAQVEPTDNSTCCLWNLRTTPHGGLVGCRERSETRVWPAGAEGQRAWNWSEFHRHERKLPGNRHEKSRLNWTRIFGLEQESRL